MCSLNGIPNFESPLGIHLFCPLAMVNHNCPGYRAGQIQERLSSWRAAACLCLFDSRIAPHFSQFSLVHLHILHRKPLPRMLIPWHLCTPSCPSSYKTPQALQLVKSKEGRRD